MYWGPTRCQLYSCWLSNCPCVWVFLSAELWDIEAQTSLPQLWVNRCPGFREETGIPRDLLPSLLVQECLWARASQEIRLSPVTLDFPVLKWEYCWYTPCSAVMKTLIKGYKCLDERRCSRDGSVCYHYGDTAAVVILPLGVHPWHVRHGHPVFRA